MEFNAQSQPPPKGWYILVSPFNLSATNNFADNCIALPDFTNNYGWVQMSQSLNPVLRHENA